MSVPTKILYEGKRNRKSKHEDCHNELLGGIQQETFDFRREELRHRVAANLYCLSPIASALNWRKGAERNFLPRRALKSLAIRIRKCWGTHENQGRTNDHGL